MARIALPPSAVQSKSGYELTAIVVISPRILGINKPKIAEPTVSITATVIGKRYPLIDFKNTLKDCHILLSLCFFVLLGMLPSFCFAKFRSVFFI